MRKNNKRKINIFILIIISIIILCACKKEVSMEKEEVTTIQTKEIIQETEIKKETEIKQETEKTKELEAIEVYKNPEKKKGHGISDYGRDSEPMYAGLDGYVVVYGSNIRDIEDNSNFANIEWLVPYYEKDKQFINVAGYIPHKTKVHVIEQNLQHDRYDFFVGYLTVKRLDTDETIMIDVKDFVTNPYWEKGIVEASKNGLCVAEFKQVSDFYPTDDNWRKPEKYDIDDGTLVLVIGNNYNNSGNNIKAKCFNKYKEGIIACFNEKDLTVIK